MRFCLKLYKIPRCFLHPGKSHAQNGRSDATPMITNFNKRPKMSQSTRAKIQKKKKAQQLQLQCDYCEEVMNTSFKVEKI